MTRAAILALFLASSGCQVPLHPPGAGGASLTVRAAIQGADDAWAAAYIAGDTAVLAGMYTEDAVSMQADSADLEGRGAVIANLAAEVAGRSDTVLAFGTRIVSLEATDSLAWESGRVAITRRSRGDSLEAPRTTQYKYITFWRLSGDGRWRIRRDLAVGDRPGP